MLRHCLSQPARVCAFVPSYSLKALQGCTTGRAEGTTAEPTEKKTGRGEGKGKGVKIRIRLDPKDDHWNQCFSRVKATGAKVMHRGQTQAP